MENKGYPLILIFYLDVEVLKNGEIMDLLSKRITEEIEKKSDNVITFFLPTKLGESEKVECINPVIAPRETMEEIQGIIDEIKKRFDIVEGE